MRPQTPWTHKRGGRRFLVRISSELKVLKVLGRYNTPCERPWRIIVPNALSHGDPANTIPLPALAVNFHEGDQQMTKRIGIARFDLHTRIVEYFVIEPNGRPTTKSTHVLYLLRGINPRLTGFRDFDNE